MQDEEKPMWLGSDESLLSQCLESAMRYRGYFQSLVAAVSPPKSNNKVDQSILPGNISAAVVALEFPKQREIRTATPFFVAASWNGVEGTIPNLNYCGNTPYFVRSSRGTGDFHITSAADNYDWSDFEYEAEFWPRHLPAECIFSDSEFLLVNAIDAYLTGGIELGDPPASCRAGTIYLYSERLACSHCTDVLSSFLEKYKKFRVVFGFMHAHGDQVPEQLASALNSESSIYRYPPSPHQIPNSGQEFEITFQIEALLISGPHQGVFRSERGGEGGGLSKVNSDAS